MKKLAFMLLFAAIGTAFTATNANAQTTTKQFTASVDVSSLSSNTALLASGTGNWIPGAPCFSSQTHVCSRTIVSTTGTISDAEIEDGIEALASANKATSTLPLLPSGNFTVTGASGSAVINIQYRAS